MATPEPPIPIEIPWKLAATTRSLSGSTPSGSTISLFTYVPAAETLRDDYPDERLVYLKFTASIAPLSFSSLPAAYIDPTAYFPVWLALLDLRVTPSPLELGGIRPYFHAASPIRRSMVETGVVGNDVYEGESSDVSVGRSASQLHENVSSKVTTKSFGGGLGIPLVGGVSGHRSSTVVDSERNVDQYTETTNREASQERRELLSHMTNVENVLTLLSAEHLGSPYLRFALRPRPLHPLSVDPADPNLWYSQLLYRRSSGIEGIQEFITVVAVPRGSDFCVDAHLRRVFVVDLIPQPPSFGSPFDADRVIAFLNEIYPVGTPLEELDVEATPMFTPSADPATPIRPSVLFWFIPSNQNGSLRNHVVNLAWNSPGQAIHTEELGYAHYKTAEEVWLDLQRTEYEEEVVRSPLERNPPFSCSTILNTCFSFPASGKDLRVKSARDDDFGFMAIPQPATWKLPPVEESSFARLRHVNIVTRWNALETQLAEYVTNLPGFPSARLRLDQPRVVEMFLDYWERLEADDARNVGLDEAATLLGLDDGQKRSLAAAGVRDLRGLAHAVNAATRIADFNASLEKVGPVLDRQRLTPRRGWFWRRYEPPVATKPIPAQPALSVEAASQLRSAIGSTLQRSIPVPERGESSPGPSDQNPEGA